VITKPRNPRARLLAALFALLSSTTLAAHDFWILPSTFVPAVGSPVLIQLFVGEHFVGDPVRRKATQIERFFVAGPLGERDVIGREGMDPAGLLRVEAPGIWLVGYRSRPTRVELEAEAFEKYLQAEGLEHVIAERARLGESQMPGREHFSRSVKSVLHAGAAASTPGFDRILGLTLELVPERDPSYVDARGLAVRLLYQGKPLNGSLIVALHQDEGAEGRIEEVARVRSDREGRAVVPSAPGRWLIKAVQMRRAEGIDSVDWESIWTSLTFSSSSSPADATARR
jgi:uncharacterized GH25 family protein